MNAKSKIRELDRIRKDISSVLRTEHPAAEPAPQTLIVLMKNLETRVRDASRERHFAEVDARIAELLHAVGRHLR
jgi:hypothetical protein